MNPLIEAASELTSWMHARNWRFCIIGGLALQHWGEPRTTLDVDVTLLAAIGREEEYVDALLAHFDARIGDARTFALAHRIVLLRSSNGKDLDVALGMLPFEEMMMERCIMVEFGPGAVLPVCSAEDLFIMKVFSDREKDWSDARSIGRRMKQMDVQHITHWLHIFAEVKEDPALVARALHLLERDA